MNTELIREALERQAERTPDPHAVLRALPTRTAQHARRQRTLQVAAVTTVAVAAVAVTPALVLNRHEEPGSAASSEIQPAAGPQYTIPLRYRPTWLPPGLNEATSGMSTQEGFEGTSRSYTRGDGDPRRADVASLTMSVTPYRGDGERAKTLRRSTDGRFSDVDPPPERVDVNGTAGTYQVHGGPGGFGELRWRPTTDTEITLSQNELGLDQNELGLGKATLLRIARSVVPDTGTRTVPLTVGWWPNRLSTTGVRVSGADRSPMANIDAGAVSVTVGKQANKHTPAGGETLTVAGHPARWVDIPKDGLTYLVVQLGPERVLTVEVNNGFIDGPPVGRKESIRVAESVAVGENWPDEVSGR